MNSNSFKMRAAMYAKMVGITGVAEAKVLFWEQTTEVPGQHKSAEYGTSQVTAARLVSKGRIIVCHQLLIRFIFPLVLINEQVD